MHCGEGSSEGPHSRRCHVTFVVLSVDTEVGEGT